MTGVGLYRDIGWADWFWCSGLFGRGTRAKYQALVGAVDSSSRLKAEALVSFLGYELRLPGTG